SLWMNMAYFTYPYGLTMTGGRFDALFGGPPREPETKLTQREMDLARSIQDITEEVMLKMAAFAHRETGMRDLCLAGGVALNCVGNGRILREGPFDGIWIQPAAGDAGGAVGVALALWHRYLGNRRAGAESTGAWERPRATSAGTARAPRRDARDGGTLPKYGDGMNGSFLGPSFSSDEIGAFVHRTGCRAARVDPGVLADRIGGLLAGGQVVGLLQGRMEFGPRAL